MKDYHVAYLLLVHKNPAQLRRLIERLNVQNTAFWIQVDLKVSIKPFIQELSTFPNVHFVESRRSGSWGRFAFVDANIEGIKCVQQSGFPFDHLILLSGQDYPLRPVSAILDLLKTHRDKSFMHHTEVNSDCNPHVLDRISKYHLHLTSNKKIIFPYDNPGLTKRIVNVALSLSGRYPVPRILPGNRKFYFGSNWIRLSAKAVRYLLDVLSKEPELIDFFKYTLLSEEHIFQSILLAGTEAERGVIVNSNFTFCHWKRASELYTIPLGLSDLDLIIKSGDLLARKFDVHHDVAVMDYLDQHYS